LIAEADRVPAQPASPAARGVYSAVNHAVFDRVPAAANSVLDVGCGDGALGRALKVRSGCLVTGITGSMEEHRCAASVLDQVVLADLDDADLTSLGLFDVIVCSHVLEHLRDPGRLLHQLRPHLASGGRLVVALPNPLLWRQRMAFLAGRFRYTRGGIMDDTHLRFFDWITARRLVEDAGFQVVAAVAEGGCPGARFLPGALAAALDRLAVQLRPGLFGVQFVIEARLPDGR
jgi:SAM-dependent methyltransferase